MLFAGIKFLFLKLSLIGALSVIAITQKANSQELSRITEMRLVYWRAFHAEIEQRVTIDLKGVIYLTTWERKIDDKNEENKPTSSNIIESKELANLLQFANNKNIRADFAKSKFETQPDGSFIEISVRDNSFGVIFSSQNAFQTNAPESDRKLGVICMEMFKLGKIIIPKKELY